MKVATIGYEGADLRDFVESLLVSGVRTVVDVREVPISRRKGFSKNSLAAALKSVRIEYVHYRDLGDPKSGREAARAGDYESFRKIYSAHLEKPSTKKALKEVIDIACESYSCLLCFERDPNQCHRTMIANSMATTTPTKVIHLGVRHGLSAKKNRTRRSAGESAAAAQRAIY